jgi:hypothetical protein
MEVNETQTTDTAGTQGTSDAVSKETTGGGSNDASLAGAASAGEKTPGAGNPPPAGGGTQADASAAGDSAALSDWKPNFKFKVKDKELEFDDTLKGLIKSKDLETKMRELHEKAYGLDDVKAGRDTLKTQLAEKSQQFEQVSTSLKALGSLVQRKDYDSFFQALKIPKQEIINYAIQELKYAELPADQKAAIDQQRRQQQELFQVQNQNQTYQQQLAELTVKQTNFEMDQAISSPEVKAIADSFDARVGKPGAFKLEMIKRGQFYENVHQVSPPASQLAAELISLIGSQTPAQPGVIQNSQGTQSQQAQVVQNQAQKPVIPSFAGGSSTKAVTKKVPTSVEDLRKLRQERLQQQQG